MQDFLKTINKYALRGGKSQFAGMKISKRYIAQLAGSLVIQGRLNHYCAVLTAQFIVSSEVIVVASRDAIQSISCDCCTLESHNLSHLPDVGDIIGAVTFGSNVVIGYSSGVAKLTSGFKLERNYMFREYTNNILSIAATPDGSCFATGGANAIVTVWSRDVKPVHFLTGHRDWVRFVKFTVVGGDQLQLFSTGDDGLILHWDPLAGTLLSRIDFLHGQDIHAFEVSWKSGYVAVAFDSPTIDLFKPKTESSTSAGVGVVRLERVGRVTDAHRSVSTALCFTNDSQWVISAGEDETLAVSSVHLSRRLFVCESFIVRRHCMTFMNTFTSLCVIASPPESSAIVVLACATDGAAVQWVINPETLRCSYTKKLQLQIGALVAIGVMQSFFDR
uniref:Uncharacterized protein TCIL3000_11_10340 n=1 Tax=Trypanosoma congolense (strain IL3000) TaxID=1068625 RepID=G0V1P1_TRYCI|nr:unnamed protein product [Trypanosoma congolense IL3000]